MCVNDYQFRHYSAIKPKQCRRFIFINEDDIEKTFLVNISQFQEDGQVALCKIINYLSNKGLLASRRTFYWPKFNFSIKYGENCRIPFEALEDKEILFRTSINEDEQGDLKNWQSFTGLECSQAELCEKKEGTDADSIIRDECDDDDPCDRSQSESIKDDDEEYIPKLKNRYSEEEMKGDGESNQESKHEEKNLKRNKESQRLIIQVIIALKKWRKLYENKKLNLTKAAKVIGISKKSLDDYFLVVRIGEALKFDFSAHLDSKMGDLRSYIRKFNFKTTGKLTKKVKCFQLVGEVDINSLIKAYQQLSSSATQLIEDS